MIILDQTFDPKFDASNKLD